MYKFFLLSVAIIFPFLPSQKLVRKYLLKRFEKHTTMRIIIDGTETSV